ncbi:MAG: hypothetical protein OXE85_13905 [Roseovarius sp.]|nr:hypothetical protein [Roseovarius sp.]
MDYAMPHVSAFAHFQNILMFRKISKKMAVRYSVVAAVGKPKILWHFPHFSCIASRVRAT